MVTYPMLVALAVLVLAAGAEWLHAARVRRVAVLAFGPSGKPDLPGRLAPFLRVAGLVAAAWGFFVLLVVAPVTHRAVPKDIAPADRQHLIVVLDVSPSMRLRDAGPDGKRSRMERARTVLDSVFARISTDRLHTTVVAVYNGAKPVVEQTRDLEVLHNLMDDLPMHQAFPTGKTKLLEGLTEAARLAKPWPRGSATLMLVSDGDSVPPTGMPAMPPSVGGTLIVGVGDPGKGTFINGHNSRQDGTTLRQIATRLGGVYHDANVKLVPTATLGKLGSLQTEKSPNAANLREYAMAAAAAGSLLLAGLPVLLHFAGSKWNPGPLPANRTFPSPLKSRNIPV